MSGWMESFNVAVGLQDDPADASKAAINAQMSAEDRRARLAEEQFAYQKSLSDPFFKASLPAYYSLVGAITGQPQSYDPYAYNDAYTKLTPEEARNLASGYEYTTVAEHGKPHGYMKNAKTGEMIKLSNATPDAQSWLKSMGITAPQFDANKTYYRDQAGNLVEGKMQTAAPFNPTETDAYKWQQSQMEKNTRRSLRSLGRENSTFGMNAIGDQNRNLAATEYDKQLGRLADLTNIARGGSSALAGASAGFSNQQQQGISNMGNNLANANLAGGMLKQNSLYNNQSNLGSLANLGIKAWDMYQNSGSDSAGGSDWGSYNGTIDNYDANTTYAGDSPGPWAG